MTKRDRSTASREELKALINAWEKGYAAAMSDPAIPRFRQATERTMDFDGLVDMVYALPPEDRRVAVFSCGSLYVHELRQVKDEDGRFAFRDAPDKLSPPTVLGYPLNVTDGKEPLRFARAN